MFSSDFVDFTINGSGMLAEQASLASSNTLIPIYQLGKRGVSSISPNGPLRNTFNFSYTPMMDVDFGYDAINILKTIPIDSDFTGVTIELAGITGFSCYLEDYSLRVEPNSFVKAQASYTSFLPLSGNIHRNRTNVNYLSGHNVSHSYTVFCVSSGYYLTTPTFAYSYQFRPKWEPTYQFGKTTPQQVNFLGAEESMTFTRGDFTYVKFTGQDAYGGETGYFIANSGFDDPFTSLINVALHCHLHGEHGSIEDRFSSFRFNISGAKITNSELNAQVDDYLKGTTTIVNYY